MQSISIWNGANHPESRANFAPAACRKIARVDGVNSQKMLRRGAEDITLHDIVERGADSFGTKHDLLEETRFRCHAQMKAPVGCQRLRLNSSKPETNTMLPARVTSGAGAFERPIQVEIGQTPGRFSFRRRPPSVRGRAVETITYHATLILRPRWKCDRRSARMASPFLHSAPSSLASISTSSNYAASTSKWITTYSNVARLRTADREPARSSATTEALVPEFRSPTTQATAQGQGRIPRSDSPDRRTMVLMVLKMFSCPLQDEIE